MWPILSYMGLPVYNLPTCLVSNTLDYGKFHLIDTTDYIQGVFPVWRELGFRFKAIATGLLASPRQADIVAHYCVEQAKRGTTIFVDPIMGDEGKLYNGVSEESIGSMRLMLSVSDLTYPNYTEACYLTDTPYRYMALSRWEQNTDYTVMTDVILNQKLDFITKGLSAKAMVSITNLYRRISSTVNHDEPLWSIDWTAYDQGSADIWKNNLSNGGEVYVEEPYAITQKSTPSSYNFTYYLEASLNYARQFGGHNVTAMAVYNQRQYNLGVDSPHRNQAVVSRVTYDYMSKYLFEANLGITGSEQFAPKYRYGVFPSVAVGYAISQEKFWKKALPWWNRMKLRFSWGLVGNDNSTAGFLYYTAYSRTTNGYATHYIEGTAANDGARWETA